MVPPAVIFVCHHDRQRSQVASWPISFCQTIPCKSTARPGILRARKGEAEGMSRVSLIMFLSGKKGNLWQSADVNVQMTCKLYAPYHDPHVGSWKICNSRTFMHCSAVRKFATAGPLQYLVSLINQCVPLPSFSI